MRDCDFDGFGSGDVFCADGFRVGGSCTSDFGMGGGYVLIERWERTFFVAVVSVPAMITSQGCKCNARVSNSARMNPSSNSS